MLEDRHYLITLPVKNRKKALRVVELFEERDPKYVQRVSQNLKTGATEIHVYGNCIAVPMIIGLHVKRFLGKRCCTVECFTEEQWKNRQKEAA
jgi:hypothetical protein